MKRKKGVLFLMLALVLLCSCSPRWQQGEVVIVEEDNVTIQILAGQSTSDAGSEEMIGQVLQEKFPDVDFQWTCVDWGSAFDPQMTSRFAAGKVPDILIGKAQDIPVYQELGALAPIDSEVCSGVDPDTLGQVSVNGQLYGLPYNTLYQGVLYNREIFEKLDLSVPKTRQELEQVVTACEAAGITPFALHFGDTWAVGNVTMQLWMNDLFLQYPNWSENGDFAAEPLILDAFEQCRYMYEHSFPDAMQISQAECDRRFAQGEAAMFMTGTWVLQTLTQQSPDTKVGIFPYPNTTGNAKLLEETNMTFMKGSTGRNAALVDEILLELGRNRTLAEEITEFTTSNSTFVEQADTGAALTLGGSERYRESGRIANVEVGNTQFPWPFQVAVAEQTVRWLSGTLDMDGLLAFMADYSVK